MTMEEKRLHIGGLFPGVQKDDLVERFSRFGKVKEIDIKIRKDNNGSPIKTFAYVSLQTNEADLQKCFATYSKTKWKGSELRLQLAKDNFIDRLEKERKTQAELREIEAKAPPKPVEKPPVVRNKLDDIPGIENFQMKGAPPGTAIPGAENWTVGKYGRVLPVVELKRKGIRKTIKVDPSKLTHNLKRINDESYTNGSKVSNLTWQIDAHESEITKKRKGEFPDDKTQKIKKVINDESFKQKIFEVLENSKKMEEERKKADNALDVVPVVVNERFNTGLAKKLLSIAAIDGMAKFDSDSEEDVKDADGLTKKDRIAAVKQLGKSTRQLKREKMKEERRMKMEKLKAERANRKKNNAETTPGSKRQNLNENKQNSENLPNKKQKVQEIGNGNSSVGRDNLKAGSNASVLNKTNTAEKLVKSQAKVPDKNVVLVDGKRTLKAFRGTKHLSEASNIQSDGSNNKTSEPVTPGKKKIRVEKSNTIAMDGDLNLDQDIDDGQSVSSTDTAELISRKKPQSKQSQANDKVMVAQKTSRTQNWLANQSMGVDEFSAGFHQAATGNHRDSRSFRNFADGYFQDDDEDIDDFEQFAKTELAKHSRMMRRTSTKATISNKLLDTVIDKREKGDQKKMLTNNAFTSNKSEGKVNEKGDSFVKKAVTTNASVHNKGKAIVNVKGAAAQPRVYQSDSEAEESTSEDEDETAKTNNDKDIKGIVKETEDSDSEGNDSNSDDTDEEASDEDEKGDAIANGKGKEDSESDDGDSSDDSDNETKTNDDDKGIKGIVKGKEDDIESDDDDDDESSSDDEDDESTAIKNDAKGGGKGIVKGKEDDSDSNDSSSEDDATTDKTNDDKGGKGIVKDGEDDSEADSDDEDDDNSSSGDSETSDDDESSEDTKAPEKDNKFTNIKKLTKTDDSDNDDGSTSDEEESSDDENSANTESVQNKFTNVKTLTNGHGQDKISNAKKLTKADDSESESESSSGEESDSDDSSSGEEMEVDEENDTKVNALGKNINNDILNDANKLEDKIIPSTKLATKSSESKVVKDGSDSEDSSSSDENSDDESIDDENADNDDDDDENSGDESDDGSESDDSSDFGDLIAQEMKKIQPELQANSGEPGIEKKQSEVADEVKSVDDKKPKEKGLVLDSTDSSDMESDESSSENEDTDSSVSDSGNNSKEAEDKVAANAIQVKSKEVSSDSSESDSSDSDSDGEMDERTSKVESKTDVSSQGDTTLEKKLPNSKPSVDVSSDSSESDSSDGESDVENDKVTSKVENKASNSQIEETSKKPIEAPKAGAANSSSESESSDSEDESSDDSNSDKNSANSKVENRTSKSGIEEETSSKKVVESKPSSDTSSESDNESSDDNIENTLQVENRTKSGIAETSSKKVGASKASDTSSESESSDSDDESSDSGDGSNSDKNMTSIKPVETPNKTAASKGSKSDVIAKTVDSSNGLAMSNKTIQDAPTKIADSKSAKSDTTTRTVDSNRGSSTKSSRDIAKQAEDADRKRLDTLKQQKLANQEQKSAIQNALSNIDKGRTASVNKKIVFDSDSEDDDVAEVPLDANTTAASKTNPDRSSKLFDSSSSDNDSGDDSDSDDDVDEEDSARFNIKQQFEGSAGSKLATLQSRYGNDERFRLDSRFAEEASGDEEDAADGDEDLADEKLRSMRILQSVVGIKGVKAISRQDRAKIKFKDIGSMKYDPSKEEHKSFEVSQEPKTKKKKKAAEKSAEADTQETESQPEEESTPVVLPEVSKEKFYEISDSLKETFVSKAKGDAGSSGATSSGGGFSLLAAFGRKPDSEAEEDEDDAAGGDFKAAEPIPSSLRGDNLSLSNRFRLAGDDGGSEESSSSDDEHDYQSIRKKADQKADQKHSGTGSTGTGKETKADTKQVMSSTPRTFFFTEDDERLANGAQFYRRDDPDTLKQKWRENRFHLTEKYQTKYKNYKRKLADGGKPAYKERNPKNARRGR